MNPNLCAIISPTGEKCWLTWVLQYYGPHQWRKLGAGSTLGLALIGTLFSIYLIFLEPFIIGATCIWCLTSAVIMTLMLWAAATSVVKQSSVTHSGERTLTTTKAP